MATARGFTAIAPASFVSAANATGGKSERKHLLDLAKVSPVWGRGEFHEQAHRIAASRCPGFRLDHISQSVLDRLV
jgi:hypothetical protein